MNTIEYTTSIPEQELDLTCFFSEHSFFPAEEPSYKKNVRQRSELYLPTLYFPCVDPTAMSWARTLGAKTFVNWLELHTLVNHENGWNQEGRIELSLDYTMKILNMAKSTFYKNVIHPLWNYGLIDLVESDFEKNGTKALNIIVYPYPLNDRALATKPLTKIRNYKTDYKSKSKSHGEKGAQIRAIQMKIDLDKLALNDPSIYTDEELVTLESFEQESAVNDNLFTNVDNANTLEELQKGPYKQGKISTEPGFFMPNSTVSIFEPKYSTTNIIYKTEDIRYLTVNKINNLNAEFLKKSIDSLRENLFNCQNTETLNDFVDYLQNHNFSMDFIAELFDILKIYCITEPLLMNYIAMIKFDIERGMQILYPRVYVRNIFETGKKLN